jgi:hypothetical protein
MQFGIFLFLASQRPSDGGKNKQKYLNLCSLAISGPDVSLKD